jgi:hypothetical protein
MRSFRRWTVNPELKVLVAPAALPRVLLAASAYRLASTLLKKLVVFAPRA